jgi:hypothetical protein
MKFWDTSALLSLLLEERHSAVVEALLRDDAGVAVWCLTEVEIESGLSRRVRQGLARKDEAAARSRVRILAERWEEVVSLDGIRRRAVRLLRAHPLSAADAMQLAAALVLCDESPEQLEFVCLDDRLAEAARQEGFRVLP